MSRWFVVLAATVLFFSCKPGPPNGVLSESKMAHVLYDYHVAKAVGSATDSADINSRAYILAALRDNGITEAEFDSSMVWYCQHADRLYAVYTKVSERIKGNLSALGANVTEVDRYSSLTAQGDTANIWNGRSFYMLSSNGFGNRFTFEIKADSSMKLGDEYMLNFRALFIQKEGGRHGIASLAIEYDNDSIAHTDRHFYGSGDNSIIITPANRRVRRIYGYIYMMSEWNENPRNLFIFNPSLVRFSKPDETKEPTDEANSTAPDSTRKDSAQSVAAKQDSTKKDSTQGAKAKPQNAKDKPQSAKEKSKTAAEFDKLSATTPSISSESMHSTPQRKK